MRTVMLMGKITIMTTTTLMNIDTPVVMSEIPVVIVNSNSNIRSFSDRSDHVVYLRLNEATIVL